MNLITSKTNPKIKEAYAYLLSPSDYFLFEGYHLLEMALLSNSLVRTFSLAPLKDLPSNVEQYIVTEDIIKKLSSSKSPEGVVGVAKRKEALPLSSSRVLILESISDPGNMGTLLRGALSFGFLDVILLGESVSPVNPKAIASSQGAIFSLNIVKSLDTRTTLLSIKKDGYLLLGTDLKSSLPLGSYKDKKIDKLALILGNEARGVSPLALSIAEENVRIEMSRIDSLNVAMAGSILMYQFRG